MNKLPFALLLLSSPTFATNNQFLQVERVFQHGLSPSAKDIEAYAVEGRYMLNDRFFVYGRYENEQFDETSSLYSSTDFTFWHEVDESLQSMYLGAGYRDELRYGVYFTAILYGAYEQSETVGTTFRRPILEPQTLTEDNIDNKRDASGYGYTVALEKAFTSKLALQVRYRSVQIENDRYDVSDQQVGAFIRYKINLNLSASLGIEDRDNQAYLGLAYHY